MKCDLNMYHYSYNIDSSKIKYASKVTEYRTFMVPTPMHPPSIGANSGLPRMDISTYRYIVGQAQEYRAFLPACVQIAVNYRSTYFSITRAHIPKTQIEIPETQQKREAVEVILSTPYTQKEKKQKSCPTVYIEEPISLGRIANDRMMSNDKPPLTCNTVDNWNSVECKIEYSAREWEYLHVCVKLNNDQRALSLKINGVTGEVQYSHYLHSLMTKEEILADTIMFLRENKCLPTLASEKGASAIAGRDELPVVKNKDCSASDYDQEEELSCSDNELSSSSDISLISTDSAMDDELTTSPVQKSMPTEEKGELGKSGNNVSLEARRLPDSQMVHQGLEETFINKIQLS